MWRAGSALDAGSSTINNITASTRRKVIIAPHEVDEHRIRNIANQFPSKTIQYTKLEDSDTEHADILIIDTIGILSKLYRFATLAVIGGGFGRGIHNILEAVTFGVPVLFGPNYKKFKEATDLIEAGGAFAVKNQSEFEQTLKHLLEDAFRLYFVY